MSLSDRLKAATRVSWSPPEPSLEAVPDPVPTPAPDPDAVVVPSDLAPHATASATLGQDVVGHADPLTVIKRRVSDAMFRRLGPKLAESTLGERELREAVMRELASVLAAERVPLSDHERQQLVALVTHDLVGYGPIEPFLRDDSVTEIMVNGLDPVYVERDGRVVRTDVRFGSDEHLRQVIDRIVVGVGRRIDESSPMVDARLPDGSRVNAIIPPLAVDGPALTVRKFSQRAMTVDDLVQRRSMSRETAELLDACVRGRLNILVTGGTGSGKTTLLNVLSSFIPDDQRIVTIEDAVELRLNQRHVIRLEARPANVEGRGQVTIRDLVRNSLRMRPDRIIVGEVRSGEALDMLQAMNTGHNGSLSTVHANQPRDALSRLETMVLMAGFDLPIRAIREQVSSALDLIVHVERMRDGSRRVTHVVEVEGMEGDIITLTDVFVFDHGQGTDASGQVTGQLRPTGLRPKFTERLAQVGIEIPSRILGLSSSGHGAAGSPTVPAGWAR